LQRRVIDLLWSNDVEKYPAVKDRQKGRGAVALQPDLIANFFILGGKIQARAGLFLLIFTKRQTLIFLLQNVTSVHPSSNCCIGL
jgi:hypothetical protein